MPRKARSGGAHHAGESLGSIAEPARNTPVIADPDVLVVGGGAAGICAAVAAARAGSRTLLIERYGFLGGTLTAVTLGGFCGTHAIVDATHLARVTGGLYLEIEDRLRRRDAILPPQRHGRILGVPYESASFKLVADEMVAAYGVRVLHHTFAVAVQTEGSRIGAVIVENKGGRAAILPRMVIDCSGDGDVAVRAGAAFDLGDAGHTQYGSTMFRLGNIDTERARKLSREDIRVCLEKAVDAGYPLPRVTTGVHYNPLPGVAHLNVTKLGDARGEPYNLVDPDQLSEAERVGRRQVYLYEDVFRRFVPGFEQARVIDIGANIGIRETRLIHGEKTLSEEMVRGCVKPADRIACSSWPLENHSPGLATSWEFLPDGDYYGIPYGCLVVKGFDNLLVAGRNLSATHVAQASARVAGPCFAMGEAAGLAAAQSIQANAPPRELDVDRLQSTLQRHGAILAPALS